LNDKVVNYVMGLLQVRSDTKVAAWNTANALHRLTSHFFSSTFIAKILENDTYTYPNVKRWTKKFDIFEKDKIFLPVNINNTHWTLLVVFMQDREIHYYDSMSGLTDLYLNAAMDWIVDEGREKKKIKVHRSEWTLRKGYPHQVMGAICTRQGASANYLAARLQQTGGSQAYVPQQTNLVDCGMFTCIFADLTADDTPLVGSLSQENMMHLRLKTGTDIMRGTLSYAKPTYT
jgi:sentrin-specific protease 1